MVIVHRDNRSGDINKFVLEKEINKDNVQELIDNWRHEIAPAFFKSQKPPVIDMDPVKTVVRATFDDLVVDNDKFVLVSFVAPWCDWCRRLVPILTELSKKVNYLENLVIAKIDATQNEIEGFPIHSFPTIFFFKPGSKDQP